MRNEFGREKIETQIKNGELIQSVKKTDEDDKEIDWFFYSELDCLDYLWTDLFRPQL